METELAPPCCRENSVMEQVFIRWRPSAQCTIPFWAASRLNATALFGNLLPHMLARKLEQHECASVSGACEIQYSFSLCVCSGNTHVCSNNLQKLSISWNGSSITFKNMIKCFIEIEMGCGSWLNSSWQSHDFRVSTYFIATVPQQGIRRGFLVQCTWCLLIQNTE
jgi:hypothetical protein